MSACLSLPRVKESKDAPRPPSLHATNLLFLIIMLVLSSQLMCAWGFIAATHVYSCLRKLSRRMWASSPSKMFYLIFKVFFCLELTELELMWGHLPATEPVCHPDYLIVMTLTTFTIWAHGWSISPDNCGCRDVAGNNWEIIWNRTNHTRQSSSLLQSACSRVQGEVRCLIFQTEWCSLRMADHLSICPTFYPCQKWSAIFAWESRSGCLYKVIVLLPNKSQICYLFLLSLSHCMILHTAHLTNHTVSAHYVGLSPAGEMLLFLQQDSAFSLFVPLCFSSLLIRKLQIYF